MLDHLVHLVVGNEGAVYTHRHTGARREIQHVAVTEQRLRTH